jgi:hypothetical protein
LEIGNWKLEIEFFPVLSDFLKIITMKPFALATLLIVFILQSCQSPETKHLIADKSYRILVHQQFLIQKELAAGRDSALFSVFDQQLTTAEIQGLEFLYAFMPLSDMAMNDGDYYLAQVKSALEAREFFSWGSRIPEDIFLHFVLPYRVNNEYTDTARQVFFAELKHRIKDMDMASAALEVNHWCHEKVVYKSTDERTSGPLTTVRTAFGRCGEESTFTAAAMRSVGIPARQVYTPRWAHTDDNHAWVEVWIDGKWHFLGACEPEPALNMGWFAEPVKRAMMTHTFVFGKYNGQEEVIEDKDNYARLNLLKNYTDTKILPVEVTNEAGEGIEDVKIEFGLYNYAEFYPITTQYTNGQGFCSVTTGFGDLMVHASLGGRSASALAAANSNDTIKITLAEHSVFFPEGEYLLTPPAKQAIAATDTALTQANNRRLLQEDSIRSIYIATFIDSVSSVKLANETGVNAAALRNFLANSRGNWNEIATFVKSLSPDNRTTGMDLLANISGKDLHDIQASTLSNHLRAVKNYQPVASLSGDDYNRYILSPRIGREFVTPWRSFIHKHFTTAQAEAFRENPLNIRAWISENITLDTINNYYGVPLSPEGILQLSRADRYSRDLLFVAIGRSFGIPARLEPATRRPQFMNASGWNDVFFTRISDKAIPRGEIVLQNLSADKDFIPRYYIHYTLARYDNGRFITLDYETDASLMNFPASLSVDTGFYRLITGNRLSDGEVLCGISYFRVAEGKKQSIGIKTATPAEKSGVIGKADLTAGFTVLETDNKEKLSTFAGSKGIIIAVIDPAKEPTKHLMEDIKAVQTQLEQWGGKIIFVVAKDKLTRGFTPSVYRNIPSTAVFGYDDNSEVATAISTACSIEGAPQWPVVVVVNKAGEIIWKSEGYRIGLGDQLVKQISLITK